MPLHMFAHSTCIDIHCALTSYHTYCLLCTALNSLHIALEITSDLPSDVSLSRWQGEPVRCLIINTGTFITNKKGYPTLSRRHQAFITSLLK
jgi:type II protein arginine methyltransferase